MMSERVVMSWVHALQRGGGGTTGTTGAATAEASAKKKKSSAVVVVRWSEMATAPLSLADIKDIIRQSSESAFTTCCESRLQSGCM
jgi:hypothetical protein